MKTKRQWGLAPHEVSAAFLKPLGITPATRTRPRYRRRSLCCLLFLGLVWPLWEAVGQGIPDTNYPVFLSSWSFTDTNTWVSDLGYASLSFTNLSSSTLGNGPAVVVDSAEPAWLHYNVFENDGTTNLTVDQGSVLFWFAPYWSGTNEGGTGPGQWSRLIEVGSYTTNASYGWWSLYTDPDGVNLYFTAQTNDGSQANYLSAPIDWVTNRWHLLVLTYCSTNCALYVDGELATNGSPVTYWPGPDVLTNGFYIGSAHDGSAQAHGMFDSLETYATPLDADTIHDIFWFGLVPYDLNPYNSANISTAPYTPASAPAFVAITGSGYLLTVATNLSDCVTSSNVWLTNVVATVATNGTLNVAFTIAGGSNSLAYDVFATARLQMPITNAQWGWVGQGYHCSRYTLTNLPSSEALLILGTPTDSDGDGLTDAYELLASHTDPHKADTSGDGMWDGWKVYWGLNPLTNNPAQTAQRANFTYYAEGWLSGSSGVRAETVGSDYEGNVTGN